jgi:hypothetical protein
MSEADSDSDQTAEIMKELMRAERQHEITQATTMQGQIVALVLVLKDAGILNKAHIDRWESLSEHVTSLLERMARANELRNQESEENPEQQLETLIDGADATLEFTRMMGNDDKALAPLVSHRNDLQRMLEDMRDGS